MIQGKEGLDIARSGREGIEGPTADTGKAKDRSGTVGSAGVTGEG